MGLASAVNVSKFIVLSDGFDVSGGQGMGLASAVNVCKFMVLSDGFDVSGGQGMGLASAVNVPAGTPAAIAGADWKEFPRWANAGLVTATSSIAINEKRTTDLVMSLLLE